MLIDIHTHSSESTGAFSVCSLSVGNGQGTLFAVLHMNPWQALPAFLLGILFGYVYYRTGSLRLTMLMHCVNNTMAVLFSKIPSLEEAESFSDVLSPWAYAGIFVACVAFVAATVVVLRNIPFSKDDARSNCDEIPPVTI